MNRLLRMSSIVLSFVTGFVLVVVLAKFVADEVKRELSWQMEMMDHRVQNLRDRVAGLEPKPPPPVNTDGA